MTRVAIVGGGITGLATAYFLRDLRPVLYEAGDRLGGVIATESVDGFLIEGGPDSFLAAKPAARELCEQLGIDVIASRNGSPYVYSGGRLHPMRFFGGSLFTVAGKLRMALDLVRPRTDDASIGGYVRKRLGQEAVDKFADPMFGGIFMAPTDRISLSATLPHLRARRSLLWAMRKSRPTFLTPRGGMQQLVEALRASEVEYRTGTPVNTLGVADAVVLATPAPVTSQLLGIPCSIPYTSTTTVSLGFGESDLPEGSGFVVPPVEGRRLKACTWSSRKFEGRAPDGHALVRCFFDGEATVADARRELAEIMGIGAEPIIARRRQATHPIYEVGHEHRVADLESRLPRNVVVAGSAWRGSGVPDCIRDARRAADEVRRRVFPQRHGE